MLDLLVIFSVIALLTGWMIVVLLRRDSGARTHTTEGRAVEAEARGRFEGLAGDSRCLDGNVAYARSEAIRKSNRY
ncbi:hypothetical protein QNO07_19385 [Streptomyces sp. 549]|uniref:hypothetical protein n=1 Tax=Streptomyces sp. 549 TaxID=3049076 RepID=UPI0024C40205|nr:hypothetical protein [Streptomyces sp. 549]MDK1475554.1 hypothetical protein [Streptomyces sp. 549]